MVIEASIYYHLTAAATEAASPSNQGVPTTHPPVIYRSIRLFHFNFTPRSSGQHHRHFVGEVVNPADWGTRRENLHLSLSLSLSCLAIPIFSPLAVDRRLKVPHSNQHCQHLRTPSPPPPSHPPTPAEEKEAEEKKVSLSPRRPHGITTPTHSPTGTKREKARERTMDGWMERRKREIEGLSRSRVQVEKGKMHLHHQTHIVKKWSVSYVHPWALSRLGFPGFWKDDNCLPKAVKVRWQSASERGWFGRDDGENRGPTLTLA